jgi:hypothetical protein
MAQLAQGKSALATPDTRRRAAFASVGWFVLMVVADGFLAFVQHLFFDRTFPIEGVARVLLLVQIATLALMARTRIRTVSGFLVIAIVLNGLSFLIPALLQLGSGADPFLTFRALYFMFGIGILTLLVPFLQIELDRSRIFPLFFALSLLFGAAQVVTQDLLLFDTLKQEFGLQYEQFSNGRIRAVSFFASAPRFAEMLVFVMLCLSFDILTGRRFVLLRVCVYALALWLLYNTYSRAGYVLWGTATLVAAFLLRDHVFKAHTAHGLILRTLCLTGLAMALVWVGASLQVSTLAIADVTSMGARLQAWAAQAEAFATSDMMAMFFGSGVTPLFSRFESDYFATDNLMLILLRYNGLLGLTAFILFYVTVLFVALQALRSSADRLLVAMTALYVGLFFESLFIDNHNTIHLVQFVILTLVTARSRKTMRPASAPFQNLR